MSKIPTWDERCEKHPAHNGIVTHAMIKARMQEEIDDLRQQSAADKAEIERLRGEVAGLRKEVDLVYASYARWWFDHHEDAQFFNECVKASPDLARLLNSAAIDTAVAGAKK